MKSAVQILPQSHQQKTFSKLSNTSLQVKNSNTQNFDFVFEDQSTEEIIRSLAPLFLDLLKPMNMSLISLKGCSQNLIQNSQDPAGLALRIFSLLLKHPSSNSYRFYFSYLQISENFLQDLLADSLEPRNLTIKSDIKHGSLVENLSEFQIGSIKQLVFLLKRAEPNYKLGDRIMRFSVENFSKHSKSRGTLDICQIETSMKQINKAVDCLLKGKPLQYKSSQIIHVLYSTFNLDSQIVMFGQVSERQESLLILDTLKKNTQITPNFQHKTRKISSNELEKLLEFQWTTKKQYIGTSKRRGSYDPSILEVEKLMKINLSLKQELEKLSAFSLSHVDQDPLQSKVQSFVNINLRDGVNRIKQKLQAEKRCPICTLPVPCRHYSSLNLFEPSLKPLQPNRNKFNFRRSSLSARKKHSNKLQSQLAAYHQQKLNQQLLELETAQKAKQRQKFLMEKQERRRQKYHEIQKRKIEYFRAQQVQERPKQKPPRRPRNVSAQVSSIMKQVDKNIEIFSRGNQKRSDSIDLLKL